MDTSVFSDVSYCVTECVTSESQLLIWLPNADYVILM